VTPKEESAALKLLPPQPITRDHNVAGFSCGRESLDRYLIRDALKRDAAGDAKVIVLATSDLEVVGYYTVSSASVSRRAATRKLKRNSPEPVPMALIGRFAIDSRYQKQGFGRALMKDAILRIAQASEQIGIKGVLLHALDNEAKAFYARCGFSASGVEDNLMMVTLREIAAELGREQLGSE
jgi:GNAT superfamily N-acetyltransferase